MASKKVLAYPAGKLADAMGYRWIYIVSLLLFSAVYAWLAMGQPLLTSGG